MDDVLAVMDAAGSERAAICGTLEGGPMAALFAATHPDRVSALVLYASFARATWAPGLRLGLERRGPRAGDGPADRALGRGPAWRPRVAPSMRDEPGFMEWAGRLERLAASPGTIRRIFDLIGEFDVRDVLPSIRVPTLVMHRRPRQLHQGRALPLHGLEDPGCALRRARGRGQHVLDRRQRGADRRDRGVPHRHAPRARAGPDARHGAVHGHLRLDQPRRRDGRPRLALPARAPRRAVPAGARPPPRPRGEAHRRRLPRHLRRARAGDPLRGRPWRRRWARSGSRSGPGCTQASWR